MFLLCSVLQKFFLADSVEYFGSVFSSHQNEPKPGMSLSSHAGGGGGADGGCPSHESQVFWHRFFFSSPYFLHFRFLHLLSASTHSGGDGGDGGGGEGGGGGDGGGGGGGDGEGGGGDGEGGGGEPSFS